MAAVGVGNTFASAMTLVTPLGAAFMMNSDDGWPALFLSAAAMAAFGAVAGGAFMSVDRWDGERASGDKTG